MCSLRGSWGSLVRMRCFEKVPYTRKLSVAKQLGWQLHESWSDLNKGSPKLGQAFWGSLLLGSGFVEIHIEFPPHLWKSLVNLLRLAKPLCPSKQGLEFEGQGQLGGTHPPKEAT